MAPSAPPRQYILLLRQLGRFDQAISLLREDIAREEASSSGNEQLLALYALDLATAIWQKDGDVEVVLQEFQKLLNRHPDNTAIRYGYGRFLTSVGRLDDALYHLNLALGSDPFKRYDEMIRWELGITHLEKGNIERAFEQYQTILRLHPDSDGARSQIANILNMRGQAKEAKSICEEGLKLYGESMELRNSLSLIAEKEGNIDEALMHGKKAFELALFSHKVQEAQASNVFLRYCGLLSKSGNHNAVIGACDTIIQKYPYIQGRQVAFSWKASTYLQLGDYGKAETTAQEALDAVPVHLVGDRVWPTVYLGNSLKGQKREAEALEVYLQAAAEIPYATVAHWMAADLMNKQKSADKGLSISKFWLQAAVKVQPRSLMERGAIRASICTFVIYKAIFLTRLHQYDKLAASLSPENAVYAGNYGVSLARMGRAEEAVASFRRAVDLTPTLAYVYEHLGDFYRKVISDN